jgi:hypothetical protein
MISQQERESKDDFDRISEIALLRRQLAGEKQSHRKTYESLQRFLKDKIVVDVSDKAGKKELTCKFWVSNIAIAQIIDIEILIQAISAEISSSFRKHLEPES